LQFLAHGGRDVGVDTPACLALGGRGDGPGGWTLAGGEVAGYTKLLTDNRKQARLRMWREARVMGANAILAMRFDCNEIGGIMSEVAAYATAVTVEPQSASDSAVVAEA
jgi:Putative heavy-metal-binding